MLGGLGAFPPRKYLNLEALKCHFLCSYTTISVKNLRKFDRIFYLSAKLKYLILLDISCSFLNFLGHQLCILHFVYFHENLTNIAQHESKSGFFLSRSHIGRDSGFSSKIRIIPTK